MVTRSELKQKSRDRILEAAGKRLRNEGLNGAGIAAVMKDAGLTHGAFYSHFEDKNDLAREALVHALKENRKRWTGKTRTENWAERLMRLAKRYLTPNHTRNMADGCALAALCSEAARSDNAFRLTFEAELKKSLTSICEEDFETTTKEKADDALAFMALLIGSMALSRAVHSPDLSHQILRAGQTASEKMGGRND